MGGRDYTRVKRGSLNSVCDVEKEQNRISNLEEKNTITVVIGSNGTWMQGVVSPCVHEEDYLELEQVLLASSHQEILQCLLLSARTSFDLLRQTRNVLASLLLPPECLLSPHTSLSNSEQEEKSEGSSLPSPTDKRNISIEELRKEHQKFRVASSPVTLRDRPLLPRSRHAGHL